MKRPYSYPLADALRCPERRRKRGQLFDSPTPASTLRLIRRVGEGHRESFETRITRDLKH